MPSVSPEMLIARHVEKLLARPDKEKVPQLLSKTGLTFADGRVVCRDGPITTRECGTYKRAVRAIYGDTTYSFAKVNFLLGGCSCEECTTK